MVCQCDCYSDAEKLLGSNPEDPHCIKCVVKCIEDTFKIKTKRAKTLFDCELVEKTTSKKMMKLKACQEVVLLSVDEFSKIAGYSGLGIAGSYHDKTGRTLLIKGEWCFANLIHETLHSRSVFSKKMASSNLDFISEGLTELLVGMVLRKKLPNCFNKWKTASSCFLEPYEKYVKPWYYLTYKKNFERIVNLYFNIDVKAPFDELCRLLFKIHDSDFKNLFNNYQTCNYAFFSSFLDSMGSAFPTDFAEFQGTRLFNITFEHLGYF